MFCLTAKSIREKVDNFTQNCKKKEWLKHILVSHSTNSLAFVGYCVAYKVFTGVGSNFCEFGLQTAVALGTNFFELLILSAENTGIIRKRLTVVYYTDRQRL